MRCLLILLLLCLPAAAKKTVSPYDFTLVNATGYTIQEVYISPTSYRKWDSNLLRTPLLNKKSVAIHFLPLTLATSWDIKVVWQKPQFQPLEWKGFNLTALQKIVLHCDRKTGRTWTSQRS